MLLCSWLTFAAHAEPAAVIRTLTDARTLADAVVYLAHREHKELDVPDDARLDDKNVVVYAANAPLSRDSEWSAVESMLAIHGFALAATDDALVVTAAHPR